MTHSKDALKAWNTDHFAATLKEDPEKLRSDVLPIAHVISQGNK
ncbi:MAG: hypothetical protein RPU64_13380 [Candidatus Sedimenticola sp. (ex Thyasira tokunagai)]